jgi:hypothetical protein
MRGHENQIASPCVGSLDNGLIGMVVNDLYDLARYVGCFGGVFHDTEVFLAQGVALHLVLLCSIGDHHRLDRDRMEGLGRP